MYDGALDASARGMPHESDSVAGDLLRLRRRFDPLLSDPCAPLDTDAASELDVLARIHDLDDRTPPAELWRTLRPLLDAPLAA